MKNIDKLDSLCVCFPGTIVKLDPEKQIIQKQVKRFKILKTFLFTFFKTNIEQRSFIFSFQLPNLSLYLSCRYDKNLSLIYIWVLEYLNVFKGLDVKSACFCPTKLEFKHVFVRQITTFVRQNFIILYRGWIS